MRTIARATRWQLCGAALLMLTASSQLDLRVNKAMIDEDKKASVTATLSGAPDDTDVTFRVTKGRECGKLSTESAKTQAGIATVDFTGAIGVEDCRATIEAAALGNTSSASLYVNKLPLTKVRIDGVSLLALFLIASFAVDRIVRGALFALSFFALWRKLVPDEPDATANSAAAKKQRLAYVLMASLLAVVVLGWLGKVRMLEALGFTQIDPLIDTLFTGLLLVGGAERTEAILQKLGAGTGGEAAKASATPVEITGRVVLEDSHKPDQPSADAHAAHG
jgi:hypothetical protein